MAAIGYRLVMTAALALVALEGTAHANGSGHWTGPSEIYNKVCTYCHDEGVSPVILGLHVPADTIPAIVRQGRNGMPSFRESEFTDAELAGLATWLEKAEPPETSGAPK